MHNERSKNPTREGPDLKLPPQNRQLNWLQLAVGADHPATFGA